MPFLINSFCGAKEILYEQGAAVDVPRVKSQLVSSFSKKASGLRVTVGEDGEVWTREVPLYCAAPSGGIHVEPAYFKPATISPLVNPATSLLGTRLS